MNCSMNPEPQGVFNTPMMPGLGTPATNMPMPILQQNTGVNTGSDMPMSTSNINAMQSMLNQNQRPLQQQGQVGVMGGDVSPIFPTNQPIPVSADSVQFLNGFLRTQIGRKVTVEFLVGTNTLIDRTGTLLGVGANYILINEVETDDLLVCDFYNIKFVKMYY